MKDPKETGEAVGAEPLKPIELEAFVSPPRVAVNEQLKPTIFDLEKRGQEVPSVIVTPPGFTMNGTQKFIEDFERTQPIPFRRRGIYTAASVLCLLDWMKKHCPEGSPVFGQGAENLATEWAKPKLSLIGIGNYSALTFSTKVHIFFRPFIHGIVIFTEKPFSRTRCINNQNIKKTG